MTQVVLAELTKDYGATPAVIDLQLTADSGQLTALLGPSGCGKTTTLRMIAGLLAPTHGDIRFDGRSVLHVPAERRGAVMVFQKHLLFPHMTVGENVGFGLRMRGVPSGEIRRKVAAMLEQVQLGGYESRRSHELSGGQQQRVALARALVVEPAVLLLDEPLANLDANLRLEMRRLIRTLQQELAMTTLFVTHDQEEAMMLADRVAVMDGGRLLQEGSPRTLYARPATPTVGRFFRNENLLTGHKKGDAVVLDWGTALDGTGATTVQEVRVIALGDVAATCPDGPVWLTVRPEHAQVLSVGAPDAHMVPANTLPAQRVGDVVYMGSYSQVQVTVAGRLWTVHVDDGAPVLDAGSALAGGATEGITEGITEGAREVALHLPVERVWVMPRPT